MYSEWGSTHRSTCNRGYFLISAITCGIAIAPVDSHSISCLTVNGRFSSSRTSRAAYTASINLRYVLYSSLWSPIQNVSLLSGILSARAYISAVVSSVLSKSGGHPRALKSAMTSLRVMHPSMRSSITCFTDLISTGGRSRSMSLV